MHLIQEAKKIMRHSKRRVLKTTDIDSALKQIERSNVNQVFGTYPYEYEKKTNEDTTQWILKNDEINLSQFISKPITETPLKTSIQMHWALLNGEIPLVPENILPPKEKIELKKTEPDPMTVFLKEKTEDKPKRKIKMDHGKGNSRYDVWVTIPITQEVKEFFNKFLEMFNIEENDNKHNIELRVSKEVSTDFWSYVIMAKTEPSVVAVIPAIVDFIYNKCIDYISTKMNADAKMLYICMKIIKCLLENQYYNCEEIIHLFIDLLYDTLIRDDYSNESKKEWQEIIVESKNISALSLNMIIIQYGTKYQTLSTSLFESITELLRGQKCQQILNNNDKDMNEGVEGEESKLPSDTTTYLLFYGPLKLISLQNVYHSKDSVFYLKLVTDILDNPMDHQFKEHCLISKYFQA